MNKTTYYKATRPDGTDFYTGQIQYEVGKRVRPKPCPSRRQICGPGYLHAADTPSETLIGGRWPCRLFEVTGTPAVGFDHNHRHKAGFKQLTIVREIDPYLALGPNGRYVAGIIERTSKLTKEEAEALRVSWGAAWRAASNAAWEAAWGAARGAARGAAWDAASSAAWEAAWGAARDAARGAALAVLTRDLITKEQFEILYGPWRTVCGNPKVAKKVLRMGPQASVLAVFPRGVELGRELEK